MKILFTHMQRRRQQAGLTLIEIMVAMAILIMITLGLTMMFNQTQRAFIQGMTQVDVFDGGRAAFDIVVRDLERITASGAAGVQATNFFVYRPIPQIRGGSQSIVTPVLAKLPSGDDLLVQDLFFLSQEPNSFNFVGSGYWVSNTTYGAGSLYLFSTNAPPESVNLLLPRFQKATEQNNAAARNFKIIDGVVHFRIRAFGSRGTSFEDLDVSDDTFSSGPVTVYRNGQIPATIEVEMALLEPQTLEKLRAMPNKEMAESFLKDHLGNVHFFRQQILLRTAFR